MNLFAKYGFFGVLSLSISKMRTFLISKNARLIRFPIQIRNSHLIDFGYNLTTGTGCRLEVEILDSSTLEKKLIIGKNVQLNDYVHITASIGVSIGNNVLIASKIYISDCSHGEYNSINIGSNPEIPPAKRPIVSKPVSIEDNVWIGESVSVLPGVTIGRGTIVGANSVVSKSLPANVIAVGIPAKPIKKFNFETSRWEKI